MKPLTVIGMVAVALVLGFALGRVVWKSSEKSEPTTQARQNAKVEQAEAQVRTLAADRDAWKEKAESAMREADLSEKALATARAEAAPSPDAGESGGAVVSDTASATVRVETPQSDEGPRFFADRYDGALKKVDWNTVATSMSQMPPLIVRLAKDLRADARPSPEDIGRISQLNGPLVTVALNLEKEGLPGTGANGKFSDPAFMVNAMVGTLQAAKMPLSEGQERRLVDAAEYWMAEFERRRASWNDDTYLLTKLYQEAEVKDGFFQDAFDQLTPEQYALVSPEEIRDRIRLDIFSSGLVYVASVRILPFSKREEIEDSILSTAVAELKLDDAEREQARTVISQWLDHVPSELLDWPSDRLDFMGMVQAPRVTGWAKETVKLLRSLDATLNLDNPRLSELRGLNAIRVPIKR